MELHVTDHMVNSFCSVIDEWTTCSTLRHLQRHAPQIAAAVMDAGHDFSVFLTAAVSGWVYAHAPTFVKFESSLACVRLILLHDSNAMPSGERLLMPCAMPDSPHTCLPIMLCPMLCHFCCRA